ncbi:MAG: hypothetical protein RLZZ58_1119 [Pseudomonadota bacterium]|jgi:FkbM family methyltransferase
MIALLVRIFGRTLSWRFGRALYMAARGEGPNDMQSNGESWLVEAVARSVQTSDTAPVVIDCGANLGLWSAMAIDAFARAGRPAIHHLLEPTPVSRATITDRFAGADNVHVHGVALSDRNGDAQFHIVAPTGGTNSLIGDTGGAADTITVIVARGGDYFANLGIDHIALLKIDTEGHDFAVIEGFGPWLASHRIDVIQFEYNHRWLGQRRSMRDIFELAATAGYRVGRLHASGVDMFESYNPENDRFFEWNYVLILPDIARQLDAREFCWSPYNTLQPANMG